MPKTKRTTAPQPTKPKKPYPDFPLTAHPRGQWCKKIRGKVFYFGSLDDPDAALAKYCQERDDLQAGRTPQRHGGLNLADLVNLYLKASDEKREAGEISALSFRDYKWTGEKILEHFGRTLDPAKMRPVDFAGFRTWIVSQYAPSRASKTITVCKMMFRWAYEYEHLETLPRFGPDFKVSTKRAARIAKANGNGGKLFTAAEIKWLTEKTDPQFRAMILLGINCGFGNMDISELRHGMIQGNWIEFPRPKTGVHRRCPLWKETAAALKDVLATRPQPKADEDADRVFLTSRGRPFMVIRDDGRRVDKIGTRFANLLRSSDFNRRGLGYYALRHTFQTVGDGAKDPVATSAIMGHADASMAAAYREMIDDQRLRAVTEHVRRWLFN